MMDVVIISLVWILLQAQIIIYDEWPVSTSRRFIRIFHKRFLTLTHEGPPVDAAEVSDFLTVQKNTKEMPFKFTKAEIVPIIRKSDPKNHQATTL